MTVCITGDVHHMSLGTRDQAYMEQTEVETAIEYAEIAASQRVPVTLFVTGRAVIEESERVRALAEMEHVELGGHNYFAFDTAIHKLWRGIGKMTGGLVGSWNGPRRFQSWEIAHTQAAFSRVGVDLRSWRDHAYRHDEHTASLLSQKGFTHFSDAVGPDKRVRRVDGVTVVPINTPPDHEHVYHGHRTREFVADAEFSGPFGTDSYDVEEWLERVCDRIDAADSNDVLTVLAHPSCMRLADDLVSFERLVDWVGDRHETVRMSDVEFDPRVHGD